MLSACSYVYADKFTACVQHVHLPNACMHRNVSKYTYTSLAYTSHLQRDRHGVRRSLKTRLHRVVFFVEPGVKINGAYYRDVLLTQKLLPVIKQISGNEFVFQQDSAPAHRARETNELLRRETPNFISPEQWPPNSPDLNPVDYKIWATMQQRVYQTKIRNVDEL